MQTVTGYYFIVTELPFETNDLAEELEKPEASALRGINQQPSSYG